jgi:hypothetical protein
MGFSTLTNPPDTWEGHYPDILNPRNPIRISWTLATHNYPDDVAAGEAFSRFIPMSSNTPDTVTGTEVTLALQAWSKAAQY